MSRAEPPDGSRWIDRALFAPVVPTAAALFRILLAGMVVLVFWPIRWPLPEFVLSSPTLRSLYEQVVLTGAYWTAVVGITVLFAIGVRPRLAGATLVAILLPLVPFEGRQPARQLLVTTLLAFSFLRSDAAMALRFSPGITPRSPGPSWPIRLIQLQLSVVYAANAISKTTPEYLSGQVLAMMLQELPNFLVRASEGHIALGAMSIPLDLAATAVVLTEYALATGFWFRRTRVATAVLGVAFHTALRYVIRIGFLDVVTVFLYSAFLLPFDRRGGKAQASGGSSPLEARDLWIESAEGGQRDAVTWRSPRRAPPGRAPRR
jgi:hypothetical protein